MDEPKFKIVYVNPLIILSDENWEKIKKYCLDKGLNPERDWIAVLNEIIMDYFNKNPSRIVEDIEVIGVGKPTSHQ